MNGASQTALIAGAGLQVDLSEGGGADNDNEDIVIDLFAGGGGTSEGAKEAIGRDPDIAVNHDAPAIAMHAANHPSTLHLCEDIRKIDVGELLNRPRFVGRRVGILWASPDCKHHSKAAGGRPKDKNIRGLAWEVLRWTAAIKRTTGHPPRLIAIENVEEFTEWCPVHRYGKKAGQVQKGRIGETFNLWVQSLRDLGARRVEWRYLVAAKFGVPTTRKRLYLVAVFEDENLGDWPEETHAPRAAIKDQGDLFDLEPVERLQPYRSAAEIIEWDRPIPSIFGRKKDLKPKTKARIFKGIERYVIKAPRPFLVKVTHTKSSAMAKAADEPLDTITTAKGGELAVAAPHITKFRGGSVGHEIDGPLHTITANSFQKRPGGAAPLGLVGAFMKPRYGERDGQDPRALDVAAPMPTIVPTGNGADLAGVYLEQANTRDVGASAAEPARTVTGKGKQGIVAAQLAGGASIGVGGRAGQSPPRGLDEAVNTLTAKGDRAIATAFLGRQFGSTVSGRSLEEPHPAVMSDGGGAKSQVVAPIIDKYYGSGVAADAQDPLDTATAKARFGLGAAFIEQANTGMVGKSPDEPLATIVAGGSSGWGTTQRLVRARLEAIEAEDGPKRRAVLEFLWEHAGAPTEAEWAAPLATAQSRLKFGLVVVDGVVFQIVDIGMRMLVPRELYRAQGFPDTYQIEITFQGKPLTKTAQTRMAGNSVCPKMAAVILTAFMPPAMRMARAA